MAIGALIPPPSPHPNHFIEYVRMNTCMSRPKSQNISRSPNARTLILEPKHFYTWGIDAIKIFLELVEGFWSFEKFQFFGIISRIL